MPDAPDMDSTVGHAVKQEALQADAAPDPGRRWVRLLGRIVLAGWWGLMFVGTHVPMPPSEGEPPLPDKLIHYLMFTVLGVLLPLWSGWGTPVVARGVRMFGLIAAYAAADELLQIPVGRSAEWGDFACDLAGGATGLLIAAALRRWGQTIQVPNSRRS
jgi:VanZ family protein